MKFGGILLKGSAFEQTGHELDDRQAESEPNDVVLYNIYKTKVTFKCLSSCVILHFSS